MKVEECQFCQSELKPTIRFPDQLICHNSECVESIGTYSVRQKE